MPTWVVVLLCSWLAGAFVFRAIIRLLLSKRWRKHQKQVTVLGPAPAAKTPPATWAQPPATEVGAGRTLSLGGAPARPLESWSLDWPVEAGPPPSEIGVATGPETPVVGASPTGVLPELGADGLQGSLPEDDHPKPTRYANVVLRDEQGERPVIVGPRAVVVLDVDIGPLSPESDVRAPVAVPEDLLPPGDLLLMVLLSSSDVKVGADRDSVSSSAVERSLVLPADGGRARAPNGDFGLRFFLAAPLGAGARRARLTYLYRNTVIQSQRIDLTSIEGTRGMTLIRAEVTTDFTLSQHLGRDLSALTTRPRATIVVNERGQDQHEFTVRSADAAGEILAEPLAFAVPDAKIGPRVDRLRDVLTRIAPSTLHRRRDELARDLRLLAEVGWSLYATLPAEAQDAALAIEKAGQAAVIQITLPLGSSFTLPWNLLYDIFLDSSVRPEDIPLCPLVAKWDGKTPLVADGSRACPYAADVDHGENLVCPFGFWGFRYSLEVLTSTDRPKATIVVSDGSRFVVAETQRDVRKARLDDHVNTLRATMKQFSSGAEVVEARTKKDIRTQVEKDLPFLYFLCHGRHDADRAEVMLGVGVDEQIAPTDVIGWVRAAKRLDHVIWSSPQPLVFINACGSLAIAPRDIVSYVEAFVGTAHAAGVIGTETRVDQVLAMAVAERFFSAFLLEGLSLDAALHEVKMACLAEGNLIGLAYTPYALADLRVETGSGRRSEGSVPLGVDIG